MDAAPWLDGKHTVFGQVTDGMDVVDQLEGLPTDGRDRPREDRGRSRRQPSPQRPEALGSRRDGHRSRASQARPRADIAVRNPATGARIIAQRAGDRRHRPDDVAAIVERARAGRSRLGGARLRGPRAGAPAHAAVGRRQRRADRRGRSSRRRARRTRTRTSPRSATRDDAFGFWAKHAPELPGRRERAQRQPVRGRARARRALPAARRRRRHRAVELPADELLRRRIPALAAGNAVVLKPSEGRR